MSEQYPEGSHTYVENVETLLKVGDNRAMICVDDLAELERMLIPLLRKVQTLQGKAPSVQTNAQKRVEQYRQLAK